MKTIKELESYHEFLEEMVKQWEISNDEALKLQIEVSDSVYNIVKERNDKN